MTKTTAGRMFACVIGIAAFASLALRLWLNVQEGNEPLDALWKMYRYFTIWTITAAGFLGLAIAFGRKLTASFHAGFLLSIGAVAIVYHLLLAHLADYQGLEILADEMFHTIVPAAWALYWIGFAPKKSLSFSQVPVWLAYPLIYCVCAMIRGTLEGRYPYFFLNVDKLGITGVALYIVGLLCAFALGGAAIVLAGRRIERFTS